MFWARGSAWLFGDIFPINLPSCFLSLHKLLVSTVSYIKKFSSLMAWWVRNYQILFLLNLPPCNFIWCHLELFFCNTKSWNSTKTFVFWICLPNKRKGYYCIIVSIGEGREPIVPLSFFVVNSLFTDIFCVSSQLSLSQLDECWSMPPSFLWELLRSFDQHLPSFPESLFFRTLILLFTIIPTNLSGADSRQQT